MEKYKDKNWLYEQRFNQRRSISDIAKEFGVNAETIRYFCNKFKIPAPLKESEITIEILCHECKSPFSKSLSYLKRRVREGHLKFFCSRKCADKNHSKEMMGENNPNFQGEYHGVQSNLWNEEKWKEVREKIRRTMVERGIAKGQNNPRWNGGHRKVNCSVCGGEYEVPPYQFKNIKEGIIAPLCSNECKGIWTVKNAKKHRTSIELKMKEELDRRSLEYEEQYVINNKFIVDFYLPKYNAVIECDGDYWHNLPDTKKRDKAKNAYLTKCGFNLFRFWEHEINSDVSSCVDKLISELS